MASILVLMYLLVPFGTVEEFYFGAGTGLATYSQDDLSDFNMFGAYARLGHQFNDYIGTEIRYGTGTSDSKSVDGINTDADIKSFASAYILGYLPIEGKIKPYALLGAGKAKLAVSPNEQDMDLSESGLSYGLGANYQLSEDIQVGLEYSSLINSDEPGDINMISFNFKINVAP